MLVVGHKACLLYTSLTDSPSLTKTGAGTLTLGADAAGAETILDGTTE